MKIISKSQLIILTLSLGIFLALGSVSAFTSPTGNAGLNNTEGPVDESSTSQLKNGGLSVESFLANGGATFAQSLTLKGLVNGDTPTSTTSTLAFGNSTYTVGINAIGSFRANTFFTSMSLAHADAGLKPICANAQGYLILCGGSGPAPFCGDTNIDPGEQCDDGNNINGDGCSSNCQNEGGSSYFLSMNCSAFGGGGCTGNFRDQGGVNYTVITPDANGWLEVPAGVYEWLGGDVNERWRCPVPSDPVDITPPVGTALELGPVPLAQSFDVEVGCH